MAVGTSAGGKRTWNPRVAAQGAGKCGGLVLVGVVARGLLPCGFVPAAGDEESPDPRPFRQFPEVCGAVTVPLQDDVSDGEQDQGGPGDHGAVIGASATHVAIILRLGPETVVKVGGVVHREDERDVGLPEVLCGVTEEPLHVPADAGRVGREHFVRFVDEYREEAGFLELE